MKAKQASTSTLSVPKAPTAIKTVEDARALLARVDAAEAAGVPMTEDNMRDLGYVKTEGGVWQLPIPVAILRQL